MLKKKKIQRFFCFGSSLIYRIGLNCIIIKGVVFFKCIPI